MPRPLAIVFYSIVISFLAACKSEPKHLFTRLDEGTTGINFRNTLFEDGPLNVTNYIYFYNGGGVAVGDINNDSLPDVLFTGNMVKNRLFLNKGNFGFEDITAQSGVAEKQGWCTGATMVDINNDGKLDIYICRSADINPQMRKNLLFINEGNGRFTEKAAEYGLADAGYSTQAAFFDYDKDGDLDCFIINHSLQKYTSGVQDNPGLRNEYNPDFASKLYRNDSGHFTDATKEAGIFSNVLTFGLGIAVSDLNEDGWPDVFVSNDFNEPDYLFINNRNGTFREQLSEAIDQTSLFSMGNDAADCNNDGLIDLVTLDMLPEDNRAQKMHNGAENFTKFQYLFGNGFYYQYSRNMLQRNNGDGTFSETAQVAGIANTDWSWSALFGDYDNDGHKDLFVTNGYVKDYTNMDFLKYSVDRAVRNTRHEAVDPIPEYIRKMPSIQIPNYIFQNNGDETFTVRTKDWGLDKPGVSAGAAYADLDRDGDLDLVINNSNDLAGIYKNNSEAVSKNNFLRIRLEGTSQNKMGISAKITVFCNGQQFFQEQSPVRGFQSACDPILNFGIGAATIVDSVRVIWPDDLFQTLISVTSNQTVVVKQQDAGRKWVYDTTAHQGAALFSQMPMPAAIHRENVFNDFTVQPLLPHYFSRQGPCLAVGDVNGDGRQDFFMGGAHNQPGRIFLQTSTGTFNAILQPNIARDSTSEDVSALFFDCDGDNDPDLYVASGGYELGAGNAALADRLYLNDGRGRFTKKEAAMPYLPYSKSCVRAADIDADGDLDLFVGERVLPGSYPQAPNSYIFKNDGKGNFGNVTTAVCPALDQLGMVTDAVWTDLNSDKQPDLVVVGEWMPVKVFLNKGGKFTDASSDYIRFASAGWWNAIKADDMDGDGDTDLVLGNCGLNTQFRVSAQQPMQLYYKDFDGNGSVDPILCYYIQGVSYPAASLDDLTEQLPGLKKKFLEYKDYADATLNEMFTPEQLKGAGVLKAETMQTTYLENTRDSGFVQRPLPMEAQYAPVHAIAVIDANSDGKKDLLLAGNNSWTRIRFGRYMANHGTLLLGDGRGRFAYVPQTQSGLRLRGNVRSLEPLEVSGKQTILAGVNDSPAVWIVPGN